MTEEVFDRILPSTDGVEVFQRKEQPAPEQACAHGRSGAVEDVEQRNASFIHRLYQLEAVNGKLVKPHIPVFFDTRQRADMSNLRMFRLIEVNEDGACRNDTLR